MVGHGGVEDEEHDQDERERGSGADPGRGVNVGPAMLEVSITTGPGSRCGSDQRAVMPTRVRAAGRGCYSADWAIWTGWQIAGTNER